MTSFFDWSDWGGEFQQGNAGQSSDIPYYYSSGKNQRDSFTYDAAGNLLSDSQTYRYDATGQQVYASGVAGGSWGPAPKYHHEPIQIGVTTVQALHITELRTAINRLRNHFGLADYPWTTSATTSDYINASPIIEMRTALNEALGPPPSPAYAPNLAQGQPVKAIHIQELRDRVTTVWNAYGSGITQAYDGAGLRVKKTEYGATTYYIRSAVLGGQVVAELNASGSWSRGFVYAGSSLMAVQQSNAVYWMYEDPVTKSRRVCDANGNTVSGVETDPYGADTSRSFSQAFQPKKFTSYDRDANGSDEAMFRRYNRWQSRFDQPDPSSRSYNFTNPQSLNRYAYVGNDPVNFADPSGLCSFSVALANQSNMPADQINAMKQRISDIFAAAGQQVSFVPANTRGADYNLTIIANAPGSLPSNVVGSTDLVAGIGSAVTDVGRVFVDRLVASATSTTAGRILFAVLRNALGNGVATAAAHEIAHRLLQQNFDSTAIPGLMHASFVGVNWFAGIHTFTAAQTMLLNQRCAPATTNTSGINNTITLRGLIREPLSGGIPFGFGQPSWWGSLQDFLSWLDGIEVEGAADWSNEGPVGPRPTAPPILKPPGFHP